MSAIHQSLLIAKSGSNSFTNFDCLVLVCDHHAERDDYSENVTVIPRTILDPFANWDFTFDVGATHIEADRGVDSIWGREGLQANSHFEQLATGGDDEFLSR